MEFRDNILEKLNTMTETLVWIVFGDSALLNEWAINNIKTQFMKQDKLANILSNVPKNIASSLIEDIHTDTIDDDSKVMSCTAEELWKHPGKNISGKWWCRLDYSILSRKDKQNLAAYIKAPNKNVLLIVTVGDYKDIMFCKKVFSRQYANSNTIHTLNIQYPSRQWLLKITSQLFNARNIKLTEEQLNMFIMKMGTAYDDYRDCVDKVATALGAPEEGTAFSDQPIEVINKDFTAATKGIDHFEINDLLKRMAVPIKSTKTLNGRRQIHRTVATLLTSLTARDLVIRLHYRVQDMIVYRAAINAGIIPVKVPYNVAQIQEKLEENSINAKLKKASAYAFKRNAYIASLTSIEDWYYLYLILDLPSNSTEEQYLSALLSAINRTALGTDRLMNAAHIKNTLDENLFLLNGILHTRWWNSINA